MASYAGRTVPELFQNIVGNIQDIIRLELRLARAEIEEEASKASRPALALGAGITILFYALGFILLAVVYALSTVMTVWLAALLVGGFLFLTAGALIFSGGKRLKQINLVPEKTVESLKEDMQWAKNQIE
jgi:uncharacterized membrane protein YqjE